MVPVAGHDFDRIEPGTFYASATFCLRLWDERQPLRHHQREHDGEGHAWKSYESSRPHCLSPFMIFEECLAGACTPGATRPVTGPCGRARGLLSCHRISLAEHRPASPEITVRLL